MDKIITTTVTAADQYSDWMEVNAGPSYNLTVTWRTVQASPPDIVIEAKVVDEQDANAVNVATINPGTNTTGMRTEELSGNFMYRVGVESGQTVDEDIVITLAY